MEGAAKRPSGNDRVSKHTSIGETKRETVEAKERERRFDSETKVEEQRYNITARSVTHGTPRVLLAQANVFTEIFRSICTRIYIYVYIYIRVKYKQ